jgi:hypothetical protein
LIKLINRSSVEVNVNPPIRCPALLDVIVIGIVFILFVIISRAIIVLVITIRVITVRIITVRIIAVRIITVRIVVVVVVVVVVLLLAFVLRADSLEEVIRVNEVPRAVALVAEVEDEAGLALVADAVYVLFRSRCQQSRRPGGGEGLERTT